MRLRSGTATIQPSLRSFGEEDSIEKMGAKKKTRTKTIRKPATKTSSTSSSAKIQVSLSGSDKARGDYLVSRQSDSGKQKSRAPKCKDIR